MLEITPTQIQLNASPYSKTDAINLAGKLLVDSGCIDSAYIASINRRELVADTYLGNGIAIPHGQPEDRHLIRRTGIVVVQAPNGVLWHEGAIVNLIVGIAAASDEHIEVLRRLTRVFSDKSLLQQLITTTDPQDIIVALTGERFVAVPSMEIPANGKSCEVVITDPVGMHARPAAQFVATARQFQSTITIVFANQAADGKSMLNMLQLGIPANATIRIIADGVDADAALHALQTILREAFDAPPEPPRGSSNIGNWTPQSVQATFKGISASDGLAVASIRLYTSQKIIATDQPGDTVSEGNRLQASLNAALADLDTVYEEVKTRLGSGKAAIFQAHAALLQDASLVQQTVALIFQGHSAAWSWQQTIQDRVAQLEKLDDPALAGRAVDLSDVGQRVLRHLTGESSRATVALSTPCILIADDLTPSDTAALDPDTLLGLCTARGGPTSHTAIIARSMGIPAVVGMGASILSLAEGSVAILDGFSGNLYVQPEESDIQAAKNLQTQLQQQQDSALIRRFEPAQTSDGHVVEVEANINRIADAGQAVEIGAAGVGLMRTEFLFLARSNAPSEEEQFQAYRDMALALGNRTLTIRTLDIGGDKAVSYLNLPKEDNSFLGMRGIRLCLARPDLFLPQLRAIYRAAAFGSIRIMFPMIATLEEVREAKSIAEKIRKELNAPTIPIGIMIEVPSSVILAEEMAQEVDFFSIGTNDLTQYTLAMDRQHPLLAKQADALHPAVLRMVERTVRAAKQVGIPVGVCGGIASDMLGSLILAGLGITELSVSIPNIPMVKAQLRSHSFAEMQALAQKALQCRTSQEVRNL